MVLPAWAHQPALTQVRISTPEQLRWFDSYNRTVKGDQKPYAERVKPFNFLGHPMPKPLSALPEGEVPDRFCLVAPAGERHPERKFAGPDGQPCQPGTQGLLQDLPLVVSGVRHVGKEGNELELHRAERQLEYPVSALEDLIAALRKIPTKVIAEVPGYNPRTVRRLKRGQFRPSSERLTDLTRPISGIITNDDRGHGVSIDEHAATATP
ncbi:MAG TPA: hypothetical protein VGW38_22425 [Chloroflexota bacterium]|nr:hypothetical protein [Chloroflexota bacterium]